MYIDFIPDNVFLKILRLLPLENQVRLGRVNKRFLQFSNSVVAETTSLDLSMGPLNNISPSSLKKLLERCRKNLQKIEFGDFGNRHNLVPVFSKFSCTNLIELKLHWASFGSDVLADLLSKNRNLRRLEWHDHDDMIWNLEFPDMVCEKMESVEFPETLDPSFVEAFVKRCPNLKSLNVSFKRVVSLAAFDRIFAYCQKIEHLEISSDRHLIRGNLINFWQLDALRHLTVRDGGWISDDVLVKISNLKQLESLEIDIDIGLSDHGISALASLTALRKLILRTNGSRIGTTNIVDNGAFSIAKKCRRLQSVDFGFSMSSAMVSYFVRNCSELSSFGVRDIVDITSSEEAVAFLQLIGEICWRNLEILITRGDSGIWRSEAFVTARKELNVGKSYTIMISDLFGLFE